MDKTAFVVMSMEEAAEEDYTEWHSKTVQERFEAMELMRQINYGVDACKGRIERVMTIGDLSDAADPA